MTEKQRKRVRRRPAKADKPVKKVEPKVQGGSGGKGPKFSF